MGLRFGNGSASGAPNPYTRCAPGLEQPGAHLQQGGKYDHTQGLLYGGYPPVATPYSIHSLNASYVIEANSFTSSGAP